MEQQTVYPLEMPGRAIANEIQCWIGDIQGALDYGDFRKDVTGACYYAARILPGWYPIVRALDRLHDAARKADNAAGSARAVSLSHWEAHYAAEAMTHATEAAAITVDLILWSIRARADFEHVAPALM